MTNWESVKDLRSVSKKLYIYGAGKYGQDIYKVLRKKNVAVDGFIVTAYEGTTSLFGLPILEFRTMKESDIGIVVGVNRRNAGSVKEVIESSGFNMKKVVWGYELIENQAVRGGYVTPTIEITTRIGCKVNCRFCPQSTLIQNYFKNDADRASVMSLDTFSECLNKTPKDCMIKFCGMSEPFLNPECLEMIKLAVSSGRTVDLYTTLVGVDVSIVEQLCEIPFGFVVLHLADKYGYANIPLTEEYYIMVDMLINMKRKDGRSFVNMCNAQAEPDEKILELCEGKYDMLTTMFDRAGNLNDPQLFKKECLSGAISCSLCGPKLDHNTLLPDGTLLLCCQDYSMKHVIGNLLENSYEEIINGNEIARVKHDMSVDGGDILCRHCSCAHPCSQDLMIGKGRGTGTNGGY